MVSGAAGLKAALVNFANSGSGNPAALRAGWKATNLSLLRYPDFGGTSDASGGGTDFLAPVADNYGFGLCEHDFNRAVLLHGGRFAIGKGALINDFTVFHLPRRHKGTASACHDGEFGRAYGNSGLGLDRGGGCGLARKKPPIRLKNFGQQIVQEK